MIGHDRGRRRQRDRQTRVEQVTEHHGGQFGRVQTVPP